MLILTITIKFTLSHSHTLTLVGVYELAIFSEPGILTAVIRMLTSGGDCATAAADLCFRMSRDNTVKVRSVRRDIKSNVYLRYIAAAYPLHFQRSTHTSLLRLLASLATINNQSMMCTHTPLLTAISSVCLTSPGTPFCNNVCLCLQNVSFPSDTRVSLMTAGEGCVVDGLMQVVSSPVDADHKTPREVGEGEERSVRT